MTKNPTSSVFNIQLFYRSKGARRENNQKSAFIQVPECISQQDFAKKINQLIKLYPNDYLLLQKKSDKDTTAILNKEILRIHVKPAKASHLLHEVVWEEAFLSLYQSVKIKNS